VVVTVVVVVELEMEVDMEVLVLESVDTAVLVYEKLVDELKGGVETHPEILHVVAPKATFEGELEPRMAPMTASRSISANVISRRFNFTRTTSLAAWVGPKATPPTAQCYLRTALDSYPESLWSSRKERQYKRPS